MPEVRVPDRLGEASAPWFCFREAEGCFIPQLPAQAVKMF